MYIDRKPGSKAPVMPYRQGPLHQYLMTRLMPVPFEGTDFRQERKKDLIACESPVAKGLEKLPCHYMAISAGNKTNRGKAEEEMGISVDTARPGLGMPSHPPRWNSSSLSYTYKCL